jgi:hypothetical protein
MTETRNGNAGLPLAGRVAVVSGGGRLRRASMVEWDTVRMPDDPDLSPGVLADLLARSRQGEPREFRVSVDAFTDLMGGADLMGPDPDPQASRGHR